MARFKNSASPMTCKPLRLVLAACAFAFLLPANSAQAAVKHWNNAAGGRWDIAANWSPSGIPTTGDDVFIDLTGTYTVNYINNGATPSVSTLQIGGGAAGTQTLTLNQNTLTIDTSALVTSNGVLSQGGGTLAGVGTVNVSGTMNWTGGPINAGGLLTVDSGGTLNVSGGNKNLRRSLTSNGTASVTGNAATTLSVESGTAFSASSGTLALTGASNFSISRSGAGTVNLNLATPTTKSGAGTLTLNNITVANTSTLDLQAGSLALTAGGYTQTAGATSLSGGSLSSSTTLSFAGGTLSGSGTITGAVSNTGANVSPGASPGNLSITGAYTQGAGGTLTIEVNDNVTAGTDYDRLQVGGAATLAGTVSITGVAANLDLGDTVIPLTYGSRSGAFTNLPVGSGVGLGSGECLEATYNAGNLTLLDVQLAAATVTPVNNGFVNAPARLRGTMSRDSGSGPLGTGITGVQIQVREKDSGGNYTTNSYWNGSAFQAAPATFTAVIDLPTMTWGSNSGPTTAAVTDGFDYEITATATSAINCTVTSSTFTANADKVKPTLTVANAPSSNATISALNNPLTGTAGDTNGVDPSGLSKVSLNLRRASNNQYWNGAAWQVGNTSFLASLSGGPGTFDWDASNLPLPGNTLATDLTDGIYNLVIFSTDVAGNNNSTTISFKVDNSAPASPVFTKVGNVNNPTDGATVTALAPIQGTATDGVGVTAVTLQVQRESDSFFWNGAAWQAASASITTSYQPLLGTWARNGGLPAIASGETYHITATAFDGVGNSTATTVTVLAPPPALLAPPSALSDEPSK